MEKKKKQNIQSDYTFPNVDQYHHLNPITDYFVNKTPKSNGVFNGDNLLNNIGTGLCDPSVVQKTGYFHVAKNNTKLFYWFFESRNDPKNDPVILWLSGGPGCSSMFALFMENGPCTIHNDSTLSHNPYSWNTKANVIYLDQPANTGLSTGMYANNEKELSIDVYNFLVEFFITYPEYSKQQFFVMGESYAGHYIPAISHYIWAKQKNDPSIKIKINLTGIAIGNGLTNPLEQIKHFPEMAFKSGTAPSRITHEQYQKMKKLNNYLVLPLINSCQRSHNKLKCYIASLAYSMIDILPFVRTGFNVYDMRIKCEVPPLCYNTSALNRFINSEVVHKYLGIEKPWKTCDKNVHAHLFFDLFENYDNLIPDLLNDDIKVLIYAGEADYICKYFNFAFF